jgi:hypothetical protein
MDRVRLVANRDPDIGARLNDGERLGAGRDTPGAHALEPRPDVVGGDEVHDAGGPGNAAEPALRRSGDNEGDHDERQGAADGPAGMTTDERAEHGFSLQSNRGPRNRVLVLVPNATGG